MEQKRRKSDSASWVIRNISVGDLIALGGAALMVISSYYALERGIAEAASKAEVLKERVDRAENRTKDDLREIKQMIRDLTVKIDNIR